jgi:hypothetical protein
MTCPLAFAFGQNCTLPKVTCKSLTPVMEKSPIESLKEWQELVAYVSENVKQTLVVPENNLAVKLEWEKDMIFHKVLLLAKYNLNGSIRTVQTEVSLLGFMEPEEKNQKIAETVRQLSEKIAYDLTEEVYSQMIVKLLEPRQGGTDFL